MRCVATHMRRLAHEVWSNQLKAKVILIYIYESSVQGYSAPFRDLLIRQNYVCRFESSSNPHQLVIETVDRHLVCRQRVPMCAVVTVRLYSPQTDPTIPRAYAPGSGPWDNLGSSGAFAWFAVLPYLWLPTGRADLSFPWVDFGRFRPVKICQEQRSVHVTTGLVSKAHIPLAASPLAPPGLGSEKEYSAMDWWF